MPFEDVSERRFPPRPRVEPEEYSAHLYIAKAARPNVEHRLRAGLASMEAMSSWEAPGPDGESDERAAAPAPGLQDAIVKVFVSWAHAHRSWAPERAVAWRQTVLDFAIALRQVGGIDADLDLWHTASHTNWSTFGVSGVRESDFILIAVSDAYRERWEETGLPNEGAGAAREANAIKGIFNRDRAEFLRRVKVVLLPGATIDDIPMELLVGTERFRVASFDLGGLESLLRSLYGRPAVLKPARGSVPSLPLSYVADVSAVASSQDAHEPELAGSDVDGADALQLRLSQIDEELEGIEDAAASSYEHELLTRERAVVAGSLTGLQHVSSLAAPSPSDAVILGGSSSGDELSQACNAAREAIAIAQQTTRTLPGIAREALFQYFRGGQPLTVGGTLDRFALEDAIRAEENGYVNWVEDVEQTVSARQAHPRVAAATQALHKVRNLAFGGVSWEARAQAAPWARALLRDDYGIEDPEFELRPVWVQLGLLKD